MADTNAAADKRFDMAHVLVGAAAVGVTAGQIHVDIEWWQWLVLGLTGVLRYTGLLVLSVAPEVLGVEFSELFLLPLLIATGYICGELLDRRRG